jgi:hypothetical protein
VYQLGLGKEGEVLANATRSGSLWDSGPAVSARFFQLIHGCPKECGFLEQTTHLNPEKLHRREIILRWITSSRGNEWTKKNSTMFANKKWRGIDRRNVGGSQMLVQPFSIVWRQKLRKRRRGDNVRRTGSVLQNLAALFSLYFSFRPRVLNLRSTDVFCQTRAHFCNTV